jgi:lysophospholipase L1-like esterase
MTIMTIGLISAFNLTRGPSTDTGNKNAQTVRETPSPDTVKLKNPNMINILTMGDSIAKGTGDEERLGLDQNLYTLLKTITKKDIVLNNIAVNGQESGGLLLQLSNTNTLRLIKNSDIIIISIGGNNLRPIRQADLDTRSNTFTEVQNAYLSDLQKIIKNIRDNNKTANIVFIGLYNPYTADNLSENLGMLITWNSNTQQLIETDEKAVFLPTYDLFKFNLQKYLYTDGLHPNSLGYKAIAQRIFQSLDNLFATQ